MDTKETTQKRRRSASTRTRQTSRTRQAPRQAKQAPRKSSRKRQKRTPTPAVVYTPAQPLSKGKLLLRLAAVVAVVLAFTFGISIFFKVQKVTVSGTEKYTPWDIREASGIQEGDSLLTMGKAQIAGKIQAALPYVDEVRIGIRLPDTVYIEVREVEVRYSVRDTGGNWWLMTAQGRLLEQVDNSIAGQNTRILGVTLDGAQVGGMAVAYEEPEATDEAGQPIPVVVRGSDRLSAALSILQYLEQNGVLGEAASLDVTDYGNIELWYGRQFQVELGDTTQLSYKVSCMMSVIETLEKRSDHESGIIDVSFTVMPDQPMYTGFE